MRFTDERTSSTRRYDRQLRTDGHGRGANDDASIGVGCPGSLIVVSNRQPYRHEYVEGAAAADGGSDGSDAPNRVDATTADGATGDDATGADAAAVDRSISVDEPTGGLTAGLDPVVQTTEGTWIAWGDGDADFDVADDRNRVAVPPGDESYTLQRIDLSDEAVDSYYYGFSNRVLWPLCHGFVDLVDDQANDYEWYRTVNERFADAVAEHATGDSVVWLQDYHFGLAARMIRERVPDSTTIAQFWHIPWPTAETFQYCPGGGAILEGLLGNDLLGFHVDRYVDRFLDCIARYLPAATVDRERRTVRYDGTVTRVVATPMGVDAESYDRAARSIESAEIGSLLAEYGIDDDTHLGLGVDRLDYSKGIPERLAAIERFLERNSGWHGEFTFLQTATPSRTAIDAYERHGDLVRSEVARINSRFGTSDWKPIVYTEDYLSNEQLCGLYRRADAMIVSPLIDGMNLVAQEYVAASVDGDGTLVLSDGTGAHDRLGGHAFSIDPTDVEGFAARLEAALAAPAQERQRRMNTLRHRVFETDLEWWMETQFDWIRRVRAADGRASGSGAGPDRDSDSERRDAADRERSETDHDEHGRRDADSESGSRERTSTA